MRPSDDELSRLLADAAPRAPAGTAEQVLARVRREQALRIRMVAGGLVAVAAAAALLLLMRPRPHELPAVAERRTLAPGQSWTVGPAVARVQLDGPAEARREQDRLFVVFGAGKLLGNGAQIDSVPALLTATGVGAEVDFDVTRRAPSTVLSVHVVTGGARIVAHGSGAVTLLGPGDHALVAAGAPPLAVRAPRPATAPARQQASTTHPLPTRPASITPDSDLDLDKEDVRKVIQTLLPRIKTCYEKALETTPNLSGRTVVLFKVRGHDGKGRVEEGEIIPSENNDLNSPATEQCILEVIGSAEFPVTSDGVATVEYPFVLMPAPPDDD